MTVPKKDNRGFLYPNINKTKPTQPDLTGKSVCNNIEYQVAVWENQTSDGKKYYSLIYSIPVVTEHTQKTTQPNAQPVKNSAPVSNNKSPITNDESNEINAFLNSIDDDDPFK